MERRVDLHRPGNPRSGSRLRGGSRYAGRTEPHRLRANMPIVLNLDLMLLRRKMSLTELSERVGITMANLSILKQSKAKAIRFSTLEAICKALECQPGDILEYVEASVERAASVE